MSATVRHDEAGHRFVIDLEGYDAVLNYVLESDDVINLSHTEVPSDHEGEGLGSRLAKAGIEYAKSNGLKVRPGCAFVRSWLERHPEYEELIVS